MNNAATLRRLALVSVVVAIISGCVSLWLLVSGRSFTPMLLIVSVVLLMLGLAFDRRASKLDEQSPG
jgi:Flp pilus assembly protein TadB